MNIIPAKKATDWILQHPFMSFAVAMYFLRRYRCSAFSEDAQNIIWAAVYRI